MFFRNYFLSVADIIDSKFNSYVLEGQNPADKGEICELLIKEFIEDSLGDSFKVVRGGKIIDREWNESKQMDVILSGKRVMKLFGDKGIYPIETVYGVFSITSTLRKAKLISSLAEFDSIPKANFDFMAYGTFTDDFIKNSLDTWVTQMPYKCLFAFKGTIRENWISDIMEYAYQSPVAMNAIPDLIVVNKVGMIEKSFFRNPQGNLDIKLSCINFKDYTNYGLPFSRVLFHLNNMSWEELFLVPKFERYFNQDIGPQEEEGPNN